MGEWENDQRPFLQKGPLDSPKILKKDVGKGKISDDVLYPALGCI